MKLQKLAISLIILGLAACNKPNYQLLDVTKHGVKADSSIVSTKKLQNLIDQCNVHGGGKLYFPPGNYKCGTIVLKDNVGLYFEAGAVLYASLDTNDYKTDFIVYKKNDSGKKGDGATPVLIYAKDAKNISLEGRGSINGQAIREYRDLESVDGFISDITQNAKESGIEMKMYYKVAPYTCMVFLENCKNVKVTDVSLIESTDWTLHFKWCEDVFIDNIYLYSSLEKGVNADGIDIDGCKNVVVNNSIITTGDDAIVLKTTQTDGISKSCENVTVSNCILTSTSTALKLGTESFADFRHILFNNCVIRNSNRGLSIVIRDGALAENIIFSNITLDCNRKHFNWWGDGDPIWLVVKKRNAQSKVGHIRNVTFDNILATGQGTSKIEGFEGAPLENIKMKNIQIQMMAEDKNDKRATNALQIENVNNIRLEDVNILWNTDKVEPKWLYSIHLNNINGFVGDNLMGSSAFNGKNHYLHLENVNNGIIERCKPTLNTGLFAIVEKSNQIVFNNNYLLNTSIKSINSKAISEKNTLR